MQFTAENGAGRQTPTRVAALCATDDGWSVVVASSESGALRVLAAERVGKNDPDGVRRVMSKHGASRLVRVIPIDEAIVRCVNLPAGTEASARDAIALLAEAQLPANIEPHRRGAALLPLPGADEGRSGLFAGWVGDNVPVQILSDDDDETWAPASGALAWLLATVPDRPWSRDPAWGVATQSGSACAIVCDDGGPRVRSGRIGDASQAVSEMYPGASLDAGRKVALDALTTEAVRALAPTSGVGSEWTDRFALALGAAIGALSSAESLFRVLAEPPRYHYTVPQRLAVGLTNQRRARALIALGLLLILAAPVALIYARHETINIKLQRAQDAIGAEGQAEVDELGRNAEFATELRKRSVPIAKILGAVADAMPVGDEENPLGVQVERIDITSERVQLSGEAASRRIVIDFTNRLKDLGLFSSVPPADVKDDSSRGTTFTINARLGSFERAIKPTGDFIENPFALRLHGEDARGYDYASVSTMQGTAAGSTQPASSSRAGSSGRTARFDGDDGSRNQADPIPEVLGKDKIAAMNFEQARAAFTERRRAASRSDIDEETKKLLAEDVDMLRDHLRAVRGN